MDRCELKTPTKIHETKLNGSEEGEEDGQKMIQSDDRIKRCHLSKVSGAFEHKAFSNDENF